MVKSNKIHLRQFLNTIRFIFAANSANIHPLRGARTTLYNAMQTLARRLGHTEDSKMCLRRNEINCDES
jgi:hypothetical protein